MKLLFTILGLTAITTLFAQRVDLDKFTYSVTYREFPDEPLPREYKTYNVRVESAPSVRGGYNEASLGDQIDISGFKKVTGTGHFTVIAILDDIVFEKSEPVERIEVRKDKNGVETRRSLFSMEMTYSFGARATVYDYKGNTIMNNYILYDRGNKKTYKSPEASTAAEALNNFNNKILDVQSNLSKSLANAAITTLNGMLNQRYGYSVQRHNDIFWVLNNKKHAEYSGHQKAWNNFKSAIVLMNPNEPVDKIREKLKPVISYYEKIKTTYTGSDKEDRKLRYASYYNLAKIYIYLDEPEKAIEEATALSMNDYDEKDGQHLRAVAESLDMTLKKNNAKSRHFPIDIASYEPPVK